MNEERLMSVILGPHVTEKTVSGSQDGFALYGFRVLKNAKKNEIKQAVEKIFQVSVTRVHTLNVRAKKARMGRIQGYHQAWKKAYVTLGKGHTIEALES